MKLKPCPFCGGKAEEDYTGSTVTYNGNKDNPTNWHEYQYGTVKCSDCGAEVDLGIDHQHDKFDLQDELFKKWNTRASDGNVSIPAWLWETVKAKADLYDKEHPIEYERSLLKPPETDND